MAGNRNPVAAGDIRAPGEERLTNKRKPCFRLLQIPFGLIADLTLSMVSSAINKAHPETDIN